MPRGHVGSSSLYISCGTAPGKMGNSSVYWWIIGLTKAGYCWNTFRYQYWYLGFFLYKIVWNAFYQKIIILIHVASPIFSSSFLDLGTKSGLHAYWLTEADEINSLDKFGIWWQDFFQYSPSLRQIGQRHNSIRVWYPVLGMTNNYFIFIFL